MYVKLILRNVRRSVKDYLIYLVTLILCVMMFYAFLSITSSYYHPDLGVQFNLELLSDGMKIAILCITLLVLFLIRYVNQYMILHRQREFALQSVMGMEQRTTAYLFFGETLLMGIFSLFVGIPAGGLVSQVITAMLLSSYGKEYVASWMLFPDTIGITILFFLFCFIVTGMQNVHMIRKTKVIMMLQAERQNEGDFRYSKWMPAITICFLLLMVWMCNTSIAVWESYYDRRLAFFVRLTFFWNILSPVLAWLICGGWLIKNWYQSGRKVRKIRMSQNMPELVLFLFPVLISIIFSTASLPVLKNSYYLGLGEDSMNSYLVFLVGSMIYVISGVIYLTSFGITRIKERFPNHKYREENLFFYGQIFSKLKTATMSMTLISLTLAVSIILFFIAPALAEWALGYLDYRAVFDVQIFTSYTQVYEKEMLRMDEYEWVEEYLIDQGIAIKEDCLFSLYLPTSEEFNNRIKYDFPVEAISLSDYNHLRTMKGLEEIFLEKGTFATQWKAIATKEEIEEFLKKHQEVLTDNGMLTLSQDSVWQAELGDYFYNRYTMVVYIFPDEICEGLLAVDRNRYFLTEQPIPYDQAIELEELFSKEYLTDAKEGTRDYYIRTSSEMINSIIASTFILKVGMIYAAVVLLISCFAILSLQQLSEADRFGYRFGVLRNMGVDEEHINRLIIRQIGFWFGLPVVIAALAAAAVVFYFLSTNLAYILAYIGEGKLFVQMVTVLGILGILLGCYFVSTWVLVWRMVK